MRPLAPRPGRRKGAPRRRLHPRPAGSAESRGPGGQASPEGAVPHRASPRVSGDSSHQGRASRPAHVPRVGLGVVPRRDGCRWQRRAVRMGAGRGCPCGARVGAWRAAPEAGRAAGVWPAVGPSVPWRRPAGHQGECVGRWGVARRGCGGGPRGALGGRRDGRRGGEAGPGRGAHACSRRARVGRARARAAGAALAGARAGGAGKRAGRAGGTATRDPSARGPRRLGTLGIRGSRGRSGAGALPADARGPFAGTEAPGRWRSLRSRALSGVKVFPGMAGGWGMLSWGVSGGRGAGLALELQV